MRKGWALRRAAHRVHTGSRARRARWPVTNTRPTAENARAKPTNPKRKAHPSDTTRLPALPARRPAGYTAAAAADRKTRHANHHAARCVCVCAVSEREGRNEKQENWAKSSGHICLFIRANAFLIFGAPSPSRVTSTLPKLGSDGGGGSVERSLRRA